MKLEITLSTDERITLRRLAGNLGAPLLAFRSGRDFSTLVDDT